MASGASKVIAALAFAAVLLVGCDGGKRDASPVAAAPSAPDVAAVARHRELLEKLATLPADAPARAAMERECNDLGAEIRRANALRIRQDTEAIRKTILEQRRGAK